MAHLDNSTYDYNADIIRAVAIVLVVCIHIATTFVDYPPYFQGLSWWLANFVNSAARVAVPLFIMLSGYLLLGKDNDNSGIKNIKRRIIRIGIPMVVWILLYFLWSIFFWNETIDFNSVITSLLSGGSYYHLYFLYIIAGLYTILPVLNIVIAHGQRSIIKYFLILSFVFSAFVTVINYLVPDAKTTFNSISLFIPYVSFFVAGSYFKRYSLSIKKARLFLLSYVGLALVTGVLNYLNMRMLNWSNLFQADPQYERYFYEHFSPNVIVMSLLIFMLLINVHRFFSFIENKFVKRLIMRLSAAALGIYLIHPMMIDIVDRFTRLNLATIDGMIWLFLFIRIFLVFLLSYVIAIVIKKFFPRIV